MRIRLFGPAHLADLREFFDRWGCTTYKLSDTTIEVVVLDAPSEREGRKEAGLYLHTWLASHPGVEAEPFDDRTASNELLLPLG